MADLTRMLDEHDLTRFIGLCIVSLSTAVQQCFVHRCEQWFDIFQSAVHRAERQIQA